MLHEKETTHFLCYVVILPETNLLDAALCTP